MKTSNKLLLGLAGLLFTIPLTAIVYDIKKNYSDTDTRITEKREVRKFNDPTKGYAGTPLTAFNSITISDGQDYYYNFTLVNDTSYGIKLPDSYKDNFSFKINAMGELEITPLKKSTGNMHQLHQYVSLFVYAPEIGKITVGNASGLAIDGTSSSLKIYAKQVGSVSFGGNSKFKQISVSAENVKEIGLSQDQVDQFTADLKNSDFRSYRTSFKSLSLSASGKSKIKMNGESPGKVATIDSLTLHTLGAGSIDITDVQMKTVSGSLSDSTVIVKMPVMYLKNLIRH